MTFNKKAIWITWEFQVRNRSLSRELGVPLYEIVVENKTTMGRYIESIGKTISLLRTQRPTIVFHQNPSIVLSFLLMCLKPIFGFKRIVDTHNAGIYPAEGKYKALNYLGKLTSCRADLMIVHNKIIAKDARNWGVQPLVLSDPLPKFDFFAPVDVDPGKVVFVCRWSADEPYHEVIEAARVLEVSESKVVVYITGKPPHTFDKSFLPSNVILTGFLSDEEYVHLLRSASLLLVLTNRENSLNCGAYEALSLAKPCVLFDTKVLREFFGEAFIYSSLDSEDLARVMLDGLAHKSFFEKELVKSKERYIASYRLELSKMVASIPNLS
jgi:glycosyltransferase involved in cell wall biosynthesis